jgi:hypothetical protein
MVDNHPISVLLREYERITRYPNLGLAGRIMDIEVIVARLDPNIRKDFDSVIVIESHGVAVHKKRDEVIVNRLSAIEAECAAQQSKDRAPSRAVCCG